MHPPQRDTPPAQADPFTISRTFYTTPERIWLAHADGSRFAGWWGPEGVQASDIELDFRPGGSCRYRLDSDNGATMWGRLDYHELHAPRRMLSTVLFTDEANNPAPHPFEPDWPRRVRSEVQLDELAPGESGRPRTRMTIRWTPIDPTEAERRTFDEGHEAMRLGWTGTLDKLERFLAQD